MNMEDTQMPGDAVGFIKETLLQAGAVAAGIAACSKVDGADLEIYRRWIDSGAHAAMSYMERHSDLRADPALLLPEASSIICCAFSFADSDTHPFADDMSVAAYAVGDDYHDVLRRRLSEAVQDIQDALGGEYRICIDSAPLRERFWANRAGLGVFGDNGSVILPRFGSMVFLAEILTTLRLPADAAAVGDCGHCGACRNACPANAIGKNGSVDSRRCLSYLTIEHRGEWSQRQNEIAKSAGYPLFGCDICLRVCPHNRDAETSRLPEFSPRPAYSALTRSDIKAMTPEEFSRIFKNSPIKRAKLTGLIRNLGK